MNDSYLIATELFETIHGLTSQLLAVLEKESEALAARQHGQLEALSMEKRTIAEALEKTMVRQQRLLESLGLPGGKEGIGKLLSRLGDAGMAVAELSDRWERIRALAESCQNLNRSNGASIELLNRHFKRALMVLQGQPDTVSTYGPNGTETTTVVSALSRVFA